MKNRNKRRVIQHELEFVQRRGGKKKRGGRKPKHDRAGVSHATRAPLASRFPVLVTTKVLPGLLTLRDDHVHSAVLEALRAGCERQNFRLVHYSAQDDHLHLIVEARDRESLSRGLQGLFVRVAKAINRVLDRRGTVFADRYHDRILRSPSEVRFALRYVLNNARKHGLIWSKDPKDPDTCSSARWFDGWKDHSPAGETLLARAKTWLLSVGWRKGGRIPITDVPGPGG